MCQNNTGCSIDGITRVCYLEPDFTSESFFCDCSSWYGFVGENCDEESVTLFYYRTTTILISIIFLVLILFTSRTFYLYVLLFRRRQNSGDKVDPVFYLLLLILLSAILMFLQAAVRVPVLFNSSLYRIVELRSLFFEDREDVASTTGQIGNQFLIAGASVIFLAEIQVILSWLKVLITFSQTFPESYGCMPLETLARIMKYLLPVLLVVITLVVGIDPFAETAFFFVLLVVILTGGYSYGYYKFVRVLKRLPKGDPGKRKAIGLVKISYQVTLVGNFGVFIFSSLYYIFSIGYLNRIEPGTFNYVILFYDCASLAAAGLVANLSWYSHVVTVRLLKIEQQTPWLPRMLSKSKRSLTFKNSKGSLSKSSSKIENQGKVEE